MSQAGPGEAKLVFTHAEPFEQPLLIRDQRLELTNLKMWFKNEGQSPAHLLTLGAMPVLTEKPLTAAEEEENLKVAATEWSVKASGEIEPGQSAFFASQNGIDDVGWADFQAKRKFLYSFVALTYRSGKSDSQDEIVTEACVWFQNADVKTVNDCQSGHNRVLRKGKE